MKTHLHAHCDYFQGLVCNCNQHLFIRRQQNPRLAFQGLSHIGNSFSWPEVSQHTVPASIKDATKGTLFIRPCYP